MDVYALGTLIHRATAGWVATGLASGDSALAPYGELAPDSPPAMAEIVDRMVSIDPAYRPDAMEVRSRLRRLLPRALVRPKATMVAPRYPHLHLVSSG
jgi:hypothetical protein